MIGVVAGSQLVAARFEVDEIQLKDGKRVRGLIVQNTADSVTIQERHGETVYPKSGIVRIIDEQDIGTEFTDIHRRGSLPPWRVLVNDLRTQDGIKSMVEIPAVRIDAGVFRNVPYRSFRMNRNVELNIYGDPESPAGIEMGIYGRQKNSERLRQIIRSYLAGYLTSRDEIGKLYSIGLESGVARSGNLTMEVTPPDGEDAFGAWWLSLFNEKELDRIRLSDADYDQLTRPNSEVVDFRGRVKDIGWTPKEIDLANAGRTGEEYIIKGFYRDASGKFRLLAED